MNPTEEKIAKLERELEQAKAQLWKEDGERYRVVWRKISDAERQRILDGLTDKKEKILFGLEAPEEEKGSLSEKAGRSGGELSCPICGKSGLTKRGLGLHTIRMHGAETGKEEGKAA